MTDQPPAASRGRHRSTPGRSRTLIIVGAVVALVAAVGVLTWLVRSGSSEPTSTASGGTLTVAVAPDIAPVLADVIAQHGLTSADCPIRIEPTDPGLVARNG